MSLLLDTHVAIWWWCAPGRLSAEVLRRMSDPGVAVYFSAASALEIATKHRLGKLPLPAPLAKDLDRSVLDEGWQLLHITVHHAAHAGAWDTPHRDPFDRLLAAQAKLEQLSLVSQDPAFTAMRVRVVW